MCKKYCLYLLSFEISRPVAEDSLVLRASRFRLILASKNPPSWVRWLKSYRPSSRLHAVEPVLAYVAWRAGTIAVFVSYERAQPAKVGTKTVASWYWGPETCTYTMCCCKAREPRKDPVRQASRAPPCGMRFTKDRQTYMGCCCKKRELPKRPCVLRPFLASGASIST